MSWIDKRKWLEKVFTAFLLQERNIIIPEALAEEYGDPDRIQFLVDQGKEEKSIKKCLINAQLLVNTKGKVTLKKIFHTHFEVDIRRLKIRKKSKEVLNKDGSPFNSSDSGLIFNLPLDSFQIAIDYFLVGDPLKLLADTGEIEERMNNE
jgi:hypothetical protein